MTLGHLKLRLGVNIDHVATIRNARGSEHPDPIRAAHLATTAGADGITAHLREDRRHISDDDIAQLVQEIDLPLNLEMAATSEMVKIALKHHPHGVCLVPERRQEVTTEGGLEVAHDASRLREVIAQLRDSGSRVSLFIDPCDVQVRAAALVGADVVELHTGAYCHAPCADELTRLSTAAVCAADEGLEVHAGHGLCYRTVSAVSAIPQIVELNIGHFLVGEAIFIGFDVAIQQMRQLMLRAREQA